MGQINHERVPSQDLHPRLPQPHHPRAPQKYHQPMGPQYRENQIVLRRRSRVRNHRPPVSKRQVKSLCQPRIGF